MTEAEAIQRANEIAEELNWPWDAAAVLVKSWRVWPLARVWQITSDVQRDNAVAMMRINDRTQKMVFGRVTYPAFK